MIENIRFSEGLKFIHCWITFFNKILPMKNTYNRISYFSTILFNSTMVLLFVIFAISFVSKPGLARANIKVLKLEGRGEYKSLKFEPNVDLSSQFTFNTKQIFLYLTCKVGENEQMAWSKIVSNGSNYGLFESQNSNYSFTVQPGADSVVFELRGNVFPYVGQMKDVSFGTLVYKLK